MAGPSGVGKTTVGRILAARACVSFVDLDERIALQAGRDIVSIFREEGEAGFRRREREALEEVAGADGLVLALGGGAVGVGLPSLGGWPRVVLMAGLPVLLARVGSAEQRPLLSGGLASRAADLLEQRRPGWRAFGPWVHTDSICPDAVALRVEAAW